MSECVCVCVCAIVTVELMYKKTRMDVTQSLNKCEEEEEEEKKRRSKRVKLTIGS